MAIREILSRMSITLSVTAILAAATTAQAQSNDEKLRSMAQFYGAATYALGANERCDLLDQGEYRGLVVLRDALTPDISRATTSEVFASLNHAPTGTKDWAKGCLARRAHDTEWRRIDSAQLIAHALQAAPTVMTSDPGKCSTGNMGENLGQMLTKGPDHIRDAGAADAAHQEACRLGHKQACTVTTTPIQPGA